MLVKRVDDSFGWQPNGGEKFADLVSKNQTGTDQFEYTLEM